MPSTDKNNHLNKQLLRKQLRISRSQASTQLATPASKSVATQLSQLNVYKTAKNIALYMPLKSEFPTQSIIQRNLLMRKRTFVPKITSARRGKMQFIELNEALAKRFIRKNKKIRSLTRNKFGIDEPIHSCTTIQARSLDIIFVPLLGFDSQGNRLGMGGGFYDRALSFKRTIKRIHKPYLIGLAFEVQQIDKLETEPWDISLDAVITEKKCYSMHPRFP